MSKHSRNLIIAGGGIGGLTAALFLANVGFRVEVFEKADGIEMIGAGIQLSPNALFALNQINLLSRIKTLATAPDSIRIISAKNGRELNTIPLGSSVLDRYELPYLVIHRADLCQVLAKACHDHPDITLHLGSEVIDAVPHPNGITAMVYQDEEITEYVGRGLIAADGIRSKFRAEYIEAKPAKYSGHAIWRALVPAEAVEAGRLDHSEVWLSPTVHGVTYPVRNNRYLNVVITKSEKKPEGNLTLGNEVSQLRKVTADWHHSFTDLLNHKVKWSRWPIYEMPAAKRWAADKLVLLGDAAHAMSPHSAQGAAMAIEDALVLTQCLSENEDPDKAFAAYEKLRMPRVRKVAALGNKNRSIFQMRPPLSRVRDAVLKMTPQGRLLSRQDWLYSWRG